MRWYLENARELPWRINKEPYRIWLSEVILQQTRVNQGIAYYNRFLEAFPDIQSLAEADEDDILKLWQGLGYYSRARNMHEAAKMIMRDDGGVFPSSYEKIRRLKGIGDYTSAAISSISFELPYPVVDGNVYRVLTRLFGVEDPIDTAAGQQKCKEIAISLMPEKNFGLHNQAIMEFGALQCVPRNPECNRCLIREHCVANQKGIVELLPRKKGKTKVKRVFVYHLIIKNGGRTLVKKQSERGIWQGLYNFPAIESEMAKGIDGLTGDVLWKDLLGENEWELSIIEEPEHLLSHRRIIPIYIIIAAKHEISRAESDYLVVDISGLHKLPVSKMMERFLAGNYQKLLYY
jgi:A/G-specific adenine glycosylase